MEVFIPGLNSTIDIIEKRVIRERRYATVYCLLQAYDYNWKDRSCQRFLKSNLTEKFNNLLLFVTVEQNRPITIIILASSESQPVSNFAAKKTKLKQVAATLKEDANKLVDKASGVPLPATINKFGKDSRRSPEIILNFF